MIPFLDLAAQYRGIKPELDQAVLAVLESGQYVLGPEVAAFENEFAQYCGAGGGVATNSGTSALHLALLAAGVEPGDEVITVPFTFVATVAAIQYVGAKPVFVDVDPVTMTMDPTRLEAAITPRTRAVLPVHLHGCTADMDPILEIAQRHRLIVIEDAAQAHGAEYRGRRAGSLGHMACFSFYPGKNLGACGEGGMVVSNDAERLRTIRILRDWGQEKKYHHVLKGFNFRMEGLQGAVLRVKLRHLERWTEARRECARAYNKLLENLPFQVPHEPSGSRHVYHVYAIRTADRDGLAEELRTEGIATGIHYPYPVHLLEAYQDLGHGIGDFPISERCASEVLSLPMYPELTAAQIDRIGTVLRDAMATRAQPFGTSR